MQPDACDERYGVERMLFFCLIQAGCSFKEPAPLNLANLDPMLGTSAPYATAIRAGRFEVVVYAPLR